MEVGKGFFEALPQLRGANLWAGLVAFLALLIFFLVWKVLTPGARLAALETAAERRRALWGALMVYARQERQTVVALASIGDTKPDYVLTRLKEMATEYCPFDDWQKEYDEADDEKAKG